MTDDRVLNAETPDELEAQWPQVRWERLKKIVLGRLELAPQPFDGIEDLLRQEMPELTHLYLWRVAELPNTLKPPASLVCLHVRNGAGVEEVDLSGLGDTLAELVLEDLGGLKRLDLPERFQELWDLSLKGCVALPEDTIHNILERAPRLKVLDLSGCDELTRIPRWSADGLERIELNRCERLEALPQRWPKRLRRLGLRGAKALARLPEFPEAWPQLLDLAGAEGLDAVPWPEKGIEKGLEPLKTLYLYGSRIRVPPASEHGSGPDENVAKPTKEYLSDVELCGRGDVRRCKLLLLGNGEAGKTCLSLALGGAQKVQDERDKLGSTHGIRFDVLQRNVNVNGLMENVHLHVWDFGGQEIYHQTHRLFMERGSIFLVLWNPDETEGAGERPLRYWLDFIRMACPWKPHVALVCSRRTQESPDLEDLRKRLKVAVGEEVPECFFVDSVERKGDWKALEHWIDEHVGAVVGAEGTHVPSYWAIAQDLVEEWLGAGDASKKKDMSREEFRKALREKIGQKISGNDSTYEKLAEVWEEGQFLTEERLSRALRFLTHSGWVFWDPDLFEGRVIIGQEWALEAIYALLERGGGVQEGLKRAGGRFTGEDLREWGWKKECTDEERKLLISFMSQAGVCFELAKAEESWWGEPVWCAFHYLPDAGDVTWKREHQYDDGCVKRVVENDLLHMGHFDQILKRLGERFGSEGTYARGAFEVCNKQGQEIRLTANVDEKGIGGCIEIHVSGEESAERAAELETFVKGLLPRPSLLGVESSGGGAEAAGERAGKVTVFISYAWNPRNQEEKNLRPREQVGTDYEKPVTDEKNGIVGALKNWGYEVLQDRECLGPQYESIVEFMKQIGNAGRVVVVLSNKYLQSWYCMHELCTAYTSLVTRPEASHKVLFFVLHPTAKALQYQGCVRRFVKYWGNVGADRFPTLLRQASNLNNGEALKMCAGTLLSVYLPDVFGRVLGENGVSQFSCWDPSNPEECLDALKEWLKQSRPSPASP